MKYKNGEPPEYWLKKAKDASLDVAVLYLTHAVEALLEERATQPVFATDGATARSIRWDEDGISAAGHGAGE